MSDFWERKYNELLDYLKEQYGATWLLDVLKGVNEKKAAGGG